MKGPFCTTAVMAINEYSLTVRVWAWGRNFSDCFQLRVDVLESIKKRFDKEGIEVPLPYRNLFQHLGGSI